MEPAAGELGSANASLSPTMTSPAMTQMGVILGTAAYMSPEQAVGKPADKRSDLWSFGVVILEMLTGRQSLAGETVSHVLASVLKDAPAWTSLPADTPGSIRRVLRRRLERDRGRAICGCTTSSVRAPSGSPTTSTPKDAFAGAPTDGRSSTGGIATAHPMSTCSTWTVARPRVSCTHPTSSITRSRVSPGIGCSCGRPGPV